jgi:DNA-binding transcriptional MocR family regulator
MYIGGLTDVLFPGAAVSWLILPNGPAKALRERLSDIGPLVPFVMRRPLERYMKEGRLESRVRRTRKSRGERRRALVGALDEVFGDLVSVSDMRSGLYIPVRVRWTADEAALLDSARRAGVALCPTSRFWHGDDGASEGAADGGGAVKGGARRSRGKGAEKAGIRRLRGKGAEEGATLLLHCGGVSAEDIPRAVRLLREAWEV